MVNVVKGMLKRQLNRLRKATSEDKDWHRSLSIQLSAHYLLSIKASHTLVSIFLTSLPPALRIVQESQIDRGNYSCPHPFRSPFMFAKITPNLKRMETHIL